MCFSGTSSTCRALLRGKKRNASLVTLNLDNSTMAKDITMDSPIVLVLTDVIVFPEVAQGNVTSNEHGNSTNTSFLHIDVFVVISFITWDEI